MITFSSLGLDDNGAYAIIANTKGTGTVSIDSHNGNVYINGSSSSQGGDFTIGISGDTLEYYISSNVSDGDSATFSIYDDDGAVNVAVYYEETGGGGGSTSTSYTATIYESGTHNVISSRSFDYNTSSIDVDWETDDPNGVIISVNSDSGVSTYFSVSPTGSINSSDGTITITKKKAWTDETDPYTVTDLVTVAPQSDSTGAATLDAVINPMWYDRQLLLEGPSSTQSVNTQLTIGDFTVTAQKAVHDSDNWEDESSLPALSWDPSIPYTHSNSDDPHAPSVEFKVSSSGYKDGTCTVNFNIPAYIEFTSGTDNIYTYQTSLSKTGAAEGDEIETILGIDTNISGWDIYPDSDANSIESSYGVHVVSYGNDAVRIYGTTEYTGSSTITGTWYIGNGLGSGSTYCTIEISLSYSSGSSPTTVYQYQISLTPSSLSIDYDDRTSNTVYFDVKRRSSTDSGTTWSDWSSNDTDDIVASEKNTSYFNVNCSNTDTAGHHGSITIVQKNNYTGSSTRYTDISIESALEEASTTLSIETSPQPSGQRETKWGYTGGNPDAIFDDYVYTATSASEDSHLVGYLSGSYSIEQYERFSYDGGDTWTDWSAVSNSVQNIDFDSGETESPLTVLKTDYPSGDYITTVNAKVIDSSVGTAATGSVDIYVYWYDDTVTHTYSLRIASPLNNAYVYQSSNGHSLYQPLASSDFTIYLTTDGVEGNTNIASNCKFSYTESGGGSGNGFPSTNNTSEDINYTIYAYWNSDDSVWDEINVIYEAYQESSEYPKYQYIARNVVFTDDTEYTTGSSFTWTISSPTLSGGTYTKVYQSKASESASWVDVSSTNETFSGGYVDSQVTINVGDHRTVNATATDSGLTLSGSVTLYAVQQDLPDTYSISIDPSSGTISTASGEVTINVTTKTNNQPVNWGDDLIIEYDSSKIQCSKDTYTNKTPVKVSLANNYSDTTTPDVIVYFKRSGNNTALAQAAIHITYVPPIPGSTYVSFADVTASIASGSSKLFHVTFSPTGSGAGVNYSLSSTADASIGSISNNASSGNGYVQVINKGKVTQNTDIILTGTHKLDNSLTDTVTITLLPSEFSIGFTAWWDNPGSYSGIASGTLTVRGSSGENFNLTISPNTSDNGRFTYGFSNGNGGYKTTYSGQIESSGYTTVTVYEYTSNENAWDADEEAVIIGTGDPSTRTDSCTVTRRLVSTSISLNASSTSFPAAGGNCTFNISSNGYTNTSFEITEYSLNSEMIENYSSYININQTGSLTLHITENTDTTLRKVTIKFNVRGTEVGDDYETNFNKSFTLTQSGRAPEQVIIVTPSSLAFAPGANSSINAQKVTIISGDYGWSITSQLPDWLAIVDDPSTNVSKTSGNSGDEICVYPTSDSQLEARSATIIFTSSGGNISGTLTVIQAENDRMLGFGHEDFSSEEGWSIDDTDFAGLLAENGWSYDSTTRTLIINIPAESPHTLNSAQLDTSVYAAYKIVSRFIGWDTKAVVENLLDEVPTWLIINPTNKFFDASTNTEETTVTVEAADYNYEADSSCYDQPRTATYIINSNLKKNQQ